MDSYALIDRYALRCVKNAQDNTNSIMAFVNYTPDRSIWTSGNVEVNVLLNHTGLSLNGWSLNHNVFTKTYTANTT
jgi:hypothetical protein